MFRVLSCLTTEHDWRLVVLAGVVCFMASLAAISLFHRARATQGWARTGWIMTAGAATGCGIWATHFIAILAYDPGSTVAFNIGLTALSLIAAIAVTTAGLTVAVSYPGRWGAPIGGGIVGAGVACMHYIGMWALELPGRVTWGLDLVAVSIVLGMLLGTGALAIAVRRDGIRAILAAALVLTLAIVSHHFTAMGAVEIVPDPTRTIDAFSLAPGSLALGIAGVAMSILGMCLIGAFGEHRLAEKLHGQNLRLDAALNNMNQGLCMFDAAGRLVVHNQRYLQMYRVSADHVKPGCALRDLLEHRSRAGTFAGNREKYADDLQAAIAAGKTSSVTLELDDGRVIAAVNLPMPSGGWVSTHEDITERRRAERDRDRTQKFLTTVIENVPATLIVKDAREHRYVLVNRAGEEFFGLSRDQMIGKNAYDLFPKAEADFILARDNEALQSSHQLCVEEHSVQTPGGATRLATSKRLVILGDDEQPEYLLGVIEDVTERKRAEAKIAHMAHHDPLTDLPNRTAFNEFLASTLERAAASQEGFAVLCIDLDRFKEVNDVFGHSVGDALLREISRRLQAAARGAFLARLGGDEFTVIATDGPQPSSAEALADCLLESVAGDIELGGQQLRIGLTIGVAIYPTDGADATTLLANADAALYRAKGEARGSIRFFQPEMDKRLRERRALQHDLRSAIARGDLALHYQPQALIGRQIVGFEALLRWHHPARGMIPPTAFIPLAEESGLIISIGEWVLREACREAASWPRPLQIAINLSPVQFQHGDLPTLVHSVLLETGLAPGRLELEITEGVLIGDFSRALSILRRLKTLGVRIAMDDFGTGYSSLSYLQSFPFDKIKIDRAFISNLDRNAQSAAIVRAVIGLGHGLNLPIVAEGVETEAQLAFLARESCDEVQGFLLGRPGPISGFANLVGHAHVATATQSVAAG
jgi:diguanylate cyclase (GGDEF)-like protein/PAS domain S-box-containing protein